MSSPLTDFVDEHDAAALAMARSMASEPDALVRHRRFVSHASDVWAPVEGGPAWVAQRMVGLALAERKDTADSAAAVVAAAGPRYAQPLPQVAWFLDVCARGGVVGGDVAAITPHGLRVLGVPNLARARAAIVDTRRRPGSSDVDLDGWGGELDWLGKQFAGHGDRVTLTAAAGLVRATGGAPGGVADNSDLAVTARLRARLPPPLRGWWHLQLDIASARLVSVDGPPPPASLLPRWAYAADIEMAQVDAPRWVRMFAESGRIRYAAADRARPVLDPRSAIDLCLRAVAEAGLAPSMALDQLVAVRLPVGYRVYVRYDPTVSTFASMTIGGPVFYVGDDGVVTRSSGSVAPPVGARRFREEYARRRGYDNTTGSDLWDDDVIGFPAGTRPSNAGGS